MSSKANGKNNLFNVKKFSHKIFSMWFLLFMERLTTAYFFFTCIWCFCWHCSNVRKANISHLPQKKNMFLLGYFNYRNSIPCSSHSLSNPKRISSVYDKYDIYTYHSQRNNYLSAEGKGPRGTDHHPKNNRIVEKTKNNTAVLLS